MKKVFFSTLLAFCLSMLPVFSACNPQETIPATEGFAIYLTKDEVPVAQMEALSHVDLADKPFISLSDIVSYTWGNHGIQLTPEAYERIDTLQVPTSGKSFVVCVDKAPIYWGAFWAGYSSQSFDGVTIHVKPILPVEDAPFSYKIWITLGYPSPSFSRGEDTRSDPLIIQALEKAGKLK